MSRKYSLKNVNGLSMVYFVVVEKHKIFIFARSYIVECRKSSVRIYRMML
jgi:hypothetical protein